MLFTGGGKDKYIYSMDLETLGIKQSRKKEGVYDAWSSLIINNHLIIGTGGTLRILSLPDLKQTHNIEMKDWV